MHFLHILPIAVHVDYCQPVKGFNHEHLDSFPQLYVTLFAHLQMLNLKHGQLASLHTHHKPLDFLKLFTHVVANFFNSHQIMAAEVLRMEVFSLLVFLEGVGLYCGLWNLFEFELNLIVPGGLIQAYAKLYDCLIHMHLFLLK